MLKANKKLLVYIFPTVILLTNYFMLYALFDEFGSIFKQLCFPNILTKKAATTVKLSSVNKIYMLRKWGKKGSCINV